MPSLQGYEVQTHRLPNSGEIDVLHAPDDTQHIWVPGQQVCELTEDGLRSDGLYSTSDMSRMIDRQYLRREPDPHRLYSRTRTLSTTLFAVEGLIQKSFHTMCDNYVWFCQMFISQILPGYTAFAAHHAELIMAWYEALEHYDVTRHYLNESTFRAAVAARNTRWITNPDDVPLLVLTTLDRNLVICTGEPPAQLQAVPLFDGRDAMTFDVARLQDVHALLVHRHEQYPEWARLMPCLVMRKPNGSIVMTDGVIVAPAEPEASPESPPETEEPVEQPLPGVPAVFMGMYPCPTFGTYEDPEWIGLCVTDALGIANPHQALARVPAEEKGLCVTATLINSGGHTRKTQTYITLKEPGLYRLISTSRKEDAERFRTWIYREVLPSIRKYGHYTAPGAQAGAQAGEQAGAQAGPTAEDIRQALRAIIRQEMPSVIEPIVLKAVRAHVEHGDLANLVKVMTENVGQLTEIAMINRAQLELSQQSIDLITPSHQLFLSAKDYVEADGVADALRRAPHLAEPSFGLDHCPDYGKASLWMKRLCRAENKKVALNAVERIIAKDAGLEMPPIYIPEFRMRKIERENNKVLMYNPACWARLKQKFLPIDTPTLLFPGPKAKPAPDADTKEAKEV
jgi:hypothetical protein